MQHEETDAPGAGDKMHFLSDEPLTADKEREVRFGHLGIVENLRKMVSACPTPFTIGLFGKWGTGKTSILEFLRDRLLKDGVAVVKFDIWKHEADALRRTFLKEATKQLQEEKFLDRFELSERLDAHIKRTFQGGLKFNRPTVITLCLALLALIIGGIVIGILWSDNLGTYISIVFGGGLVTSTLLFLLHKAATTETLTMATDPFQDPHEFETEFKKMLSNVTAERLLVIIDNLDRATHDKALELMSTIKTFLEQKRCVFLIACDDEAIKKHLQRSYAWPSQNVDGSRFYDADEFLRKFFNACFRIPDFIDTELQTYTEALLKETNVPALDSPDVAYVITAAFRENPRQIKQFINTLLSHFILAEEREVARPALIIPKGIVTDNVAYLAKCLIAQRCYPEYYEKYIAGQTVEDVDTKAERFRDFLRATGPIHVDNTRPFRYLKLSEEEIAMPQLYDLQSAMEDNNVNLVSDNIKLFKTNPQQIADFNKFVLGLLDRRSGLALYNIVSSTLLALQQQGVELKPRFYNKVADLLGDETKLSPRLSGFDPDLIFKQVLKRTIVYYKSGVIERYTNLFVNPEHIDNVVYGREEYSEILVKEFMEHKRWLSTEDKQKIRDALAQKHSNYHILSMFMGKHDEQKQFLSQEILSTFIGDISIDEVEAPSNLEQKFVLLLDFEQILTDSNVEELMAKFTELLESEAGKPFRPEKENLLACLDAIVETFSSSVQNVSPDIMNGLAQKVVNGVNALGPWEQKRIFIPTCLWLVDVMEDPMKSQVNSIISAFFTSVSLNGLNIVFQGIDDDSRREELIYRYTGVLEQRVQADQAIFDLLYQWASKDVRTEWLVKLIRANHQRAVAKLVALNYRVDDRKAVVSEILAKANQLPPEQRKDLYMVCNKTRCANDTDLRNKFASSIIPLLIHTNPNAQQIGAGAL